MATAPAADKPAAGKVYRVQLGAMKSVGLAKAEWDKLQGQYGSVLGGLKLTVQRADLGKKGIYYRVQAGPLADAAAAQKICADLKQQNQQCLVVRP
ncbi:MAG: SPOR domain-containing protein [Dongiaceae bacterium]